MALIERDLLQQTETEKPTIQRLGAGIDAERVQTDDGDLMIEPRKQCAAAAKKNTYSF